MGDSSLSHFFTRWTRPSSGDEVFLIENDGGEAATPTQLQPRRSLVTTLALALVGVVLLAGGIGLTTFFLHSPRTNDLHGTSVTTPTPPPETPPAWTRVGKEIQSFMNPDANPCQDFYDYACGGWIQLYHPPPDYPWVSALAQVTLVDNVKVVRDILGSQQELTGAGDKARNFYLSCVNHTLDLLLPEPTERWNDFWNDSLPDATLSLTRISARLTPYLNSSDPTESPTLTCATQTSTLIPDVVARLFLSETFPDSTRTSVTSLLSSITSQYITLISSTPWLDPGTKTYLIRSLTSTQHLLGGPATLFDISAESSAYADVAISASGSSYLANHAKLSSHHAYIPDLARVRMVLEANAWWTRNTLLIPGGIIRPPFFSPDYPPLVNWAKFAVTLGHEVTHAFEDYILGTWSNFGVKPASVGNTSYAAFSQIRSCLSEEYSGYRIGPNASYPVDGTRTWDENLADVLGLQVAYSGYFEHSEDSKDPRNSEIIPGLSPEQLFFVGAAQIQCESFRSVADQEQDEWETSRGLGEDPHSPNSIRVLGMMANNAQFSKAFRCPVGSKYNPAKKCGVFA